MFGNKDDFLMKAHEAFEELGYYAKSGTIDSEEFVKTAINTINHTEELMDAINATRMLQFIIWNEEKITKLVDKNLFQWNSMKYGGNELLSLVDDEGATGSFYITNAYNKNGKIIYLSGVLFEDNIYMLDEKHGKYYVNINEKSYYIRNSKLTSSEMVLLDGNDEKLAVIVLSDDCQIFLKNNRTHFELVLYEGFIGIYSKKYLESLHGGEPDTNNLLAVIEWDILTEDSKYALAKITNFSEESDLDMFFLFGAATMICYNNFINTSKLSITNAAIIAGSAWARR